jgi:hypothetical protein
VGQRGLFSSDETPVEAVAVARDAAGRAVRKMSGKYCRPGIRCVLKQPTARRARAGRILAKRAIPVGAEYLQRLMHDVSTEDRAVFMALELYGDVANGVSRRRMEHKAISHRALPVDNFRLPALDHRQNAIFVDSSVDTLLPRGTSPMLAFCLKETVSRVRKRRHPATVEQPCMPSTMIDMKMRAHHVVHRLWRNSGCRQPFEKRQIELVKALDAGPVLVIAGKTVDQNRMMTGAQNPRANT